MTKAEVMRDEISQEWEPALTLRPHHLKTLMPKSFNFMTKLTAWESPLETFLAMANFEDYYTYKEEYVKDVDGSEVALRKEIRENARRDLKRKLEALPDHAVLRLDFSKDEMCGMCVVGKHCMATNYKFQGRIRKYEDLESKAMKRLEKALRKKGSVEEEDFRMVPAQQELLDYHGEKYWLDPKDPESTIVHYDAMLVKMGALRRLIK